MEPIYNFISENKDKYSFCEIYDELIKKYSKNDVKLVFLLSYDYDIDNHISLTQRVRTNKSSLTSETETRDYQSKLRKLALKRYNGKCVISGKSRAKCLETAHIKPVFECNTTHEKEDIDNVLLLWIDMHKYFDSYDITINPNTKKVEVNRDCDDYEWLAKYEGIEINNLNYNTLQYLDLHHQKFLNNI